MANAHYYGPFLRQWGTALVSATKYSPLQILLEDGAGAVYTGAIIAGDVKVSKDGGAEANIATLPTHVGNGIWTFILNGTEMRAFNITIRIGKAGIAVTVIGIQTALVLGTFEVDAVPLGAFGGGGADVLAVYFHSAGTASGLTLDGGATGGNGLVSRGSGGGHGIRGEGNGVGSGFSGLAGASGKISNFLDVPEGTEPSGAIPANATALQMLQYNKRRFFNKVTQTITTQTVYKDDDSTTLTTMPVSDDGTTQTKGRGV